MHLPDQLSERFVILNALRRHPGKAIAPMDVFGFTGVKGAMAITDLDLRCRSKQELAHNIELGQYRKNERHDLRAQDAGESALSRREVEDPIGSLNQTLGEGDSLALICRAAPRMHRPRVRL
jgi:hypothetical protein